MAKFQSRELVAKHEAWVNRSLAKSGEDKCRILLHLGQSKLGTDCSWHPAGEKLGCAGARLNVDQKHGNCE